MPLEKISIIVPAYNAEKHIEKTLNSLIDQTYPNKEIIVINDGSTDQTQVIVDRICRENVNTVRVYHTDNNGVTMARLYGVEHACGEWIGFVDSDDFVEPDMYEVLIQNAEKTNADISHCGYKICLPDGRIRYYHNTGVQLLQDRDSALKELLDGSLIEPSLCNKVFRKSLFSVFFKEPIMDLNVKHREDLLMNFILFMQSNLSVFEDTCKYHYIVRVGSATRSALNESMINDPICIKERILGIAPKAVQTEAHKSYINTCINVYNTIISSNDQQFYPALEKISNKIRSEKSWIKHLRIKRRILALLIMYGKPVYKVGYYIYRTFFQKKKYE